VPTARLTITIDRKLDEAIRTLSKETDIPVSYIIEMGMKFLFEHSELLKQALNNRVQRETVEKVRMQQQGDYIPLTTTKAINSKKNVYAVIQCRNCGYVLTELAGVSNIRLAIDYIRKLNMSCPKCKSNELIMIIK
jgi:predicted nucleic-acid-binding Zn-ribbon protein